MSLFLNCIVDVGDDPRTTADGTADVQDSLGHAYRIFRRSSSNGNRTKVMKEHTIKKRSDNRNVCEHHLESSSGILSSNVMAKSLFCRWNISAPENFIVTIVLTILRFNDSSLVLADSAGDSCLQNGTRIVFTEFLPDFQLTQTALCEVNSAQTTALTFTTLSNRVSITVYTRRDSQIVWALMYQAIDESSFVELGQDDVYDVGSGGDFRAELSTMSYGMGADQCFELYGMTISPMNRSFGNSENCSMTFMPDLNEELMLSFLNIGLSNYPAVSNCSSDIAFLTIRTWTPDGNVNETFLCSIPSMGAQFISPVRIELHYHPSAITGRDFKAEISIAMPDFDMGGAELSSLLIKNTLMYSLTGERGNFSTLGYPNPFPNIRMIWEIIVGKGKAINLEFVDIDLGYTPPSICNETTPILFIISSPTYGREQIYCGSLPPRNIISTGGKMILIFDPKAGKVGSGIHAVYSSFDLEKDTFRGNLDIDDAWSPSPEFPIPPSMLATVVRVFADCEFLFMNATDNFTMVNNYSIDTTVNFTICWQILSSPSNFIKSIFTNISLYDSLDEDNGSTMKATYTTSLRTPFSDDGEHFRRDVDNGEAVTLSPQPTAPSKQSTDVIVIPDECAYIFTEDSGTFSTFLYPDDYPANYTSCWYISTDPSRFIMLRFQNFSLDSAQIDPCDKAYSFVTVSDFVSDEVLLCGTLENQVVKSSSNSLRIGIDGRLGQGQGFYALFETFEIPRFRSHVVTGDTGSCNGTEHLESLAISGTVRLPALMSKCTVDGTWLEWFTESEQESGWIASSMFPGRYPAGSHCLWNVRGEENVIFNLDFFDFDLGEAPGTYPPCSDADTFIRILDCVSGDEQILCGVRTENEHLVIQSNSVEIDFYSRNGQGRGFQAFYSLQKSTVESQQFKALPEGLTSVPSFTGRPVMTTPKSPPSQSIMSTLPPKIDVVSMEPDVCSGMGSDACGGSLQSEFGYFSSAFYPQKLQTKTNCIWTIESSLPDHQIALKILDIDLGAPLINGECDAVYGYIRVEISGYSAFICNNRGQSLFVSEAGLITIEYSPEYSVGRGFCAAFMSIDSMFNGSVDDLQFPCLCENLYTNISWITPTPEPTEPARCEFIIGEGSGTLPLDSFPIPYPPNFECVWTLLANPDEHVNLRFLSMDLDGVRISRRRTCLLSDTHVQITLFKETKVLNKRFCSGDDWSVTIPSSRDVTIKFTSGDIPDHDNTGFRMAYNFTRTLTSSSEVFRQDLAENTSVSESSSDENLGFRVFDGDSYSLLGPSDADSSDVDVVVETGRRTTEGDRTRLTWPVEVETEIPDPGLFSDLATELPYVYGTQLPEEPKTIVGDTAIEADIMTPISQTGRPRRTYSLDELPTGTSTLPTSGVTPGRGMS